MRGNEHKVTQKALRNSGVFEAGTHFPTPVTKVAPNRSILHSEMCACLTVGALKFRGPVEGVRCGISNF
jgi:hypothetical protein